MAADDQVGNGRGLDALPVLLRTAGPSAGRVSRLVEGELGWQVLADPSGAEVLLVDVAGAATGTAEPGLPVVLVVAEEDDPHAVAEAMRRLGPTEVARWPPRRPDDLQDAVAAAMRTRESRAVETSSLQVGGSAGGVGTTTVALALGGLSAWGGRSTVVVSHRPVPHPTLPPVDPDALASPSLDAALQPVRGVPGLRLLCLRCAPGPAAPPAGTAVTVVDRGVAADVEVLVIRRDTAGHDAISVSPAGAIVVTDVGAVPWSALRRAAGGRRIVLLPWSARVGRAAAAGRVPASLPGSWLRHLAPLVDAGPARG